MQISKIQEFYNYLMRKKLINKSLVEKLKSVSNDVDVKKVIKEDFVPLAKENGFDFTEEDLFEYEKSQCINLLSELDLESVSGGFSFRPMVGIMSLALMSTNLFTPRATNAMISDDQPSSALSKDLSKDTKKEKNNEAEDIQSSTQNEKQSSDINAATTTEESLYKEKKLNGVLYSCVGNNASIIGVDPSVKQKGEIMCWQQAPMF